VHELHRIAEQRADRLELGGLLLVVLVEVLPAGLVFAEELVEPALGDGPGLEGAPAGGGQVLRAS